MTHLDMLAAATAATPIALDALYYALNRADAPRPAPVTLPMPRHG